MRKGHPGVPTDSGRSNIDTHTTREPHHEGQGRAQQTRRRGTARQERQPEQLEQGTRMEGMGERAHGSQRQQRGWPGQPAPSLPGARATLLNRHQVGGVSRSPDGLFAQQEREPIMGRPAVRGKRTYGGRPGERVEEQGIPASRTQNHSKAGYGRPVDRGAWTAKTVKGPRQQPAHPQYANYWAPLTRKRHTMPHSAQAPTHQILGSATAETHYSQQEHRPQRPTESSNPMQHAKARTGDCPGPCKGTITRRNVTQGGEAHALKCIAAQRMGHAMPPPPPPPRGGRDRGTLQFSRTCASFSRWPRSFA